jgi:hypothetical protein
MVTARLVKDKRLYKPKTHIIVVGMELTVCGIEKRLTTPSYGKPTCKICRGKGEPHTNGSS